MELSLSGRWVPPARDEYEELPASFVAHIESLLPAANEGDMEARFTIRRMVRGY
jgi:hypothetical protein